MSTKRAAVLLAKDRCFLSSKGIQDGQYNSINLNHHKKCDGTVNRLQSETISKAFPKSNGFVGYNSTKTNVFTLWKKTNDISKSLGNLCIQGGNQEKEEKKWQKKSEMNNSTLSLHIAAYENGIENQIVDRSLGKRFEQETFASETLKNAFDFPRQFQGLMKPEMMQFKTSQKLMNLKAMEFGCGMQQITKLRSAARQQHVVQAIRSEVTATQQQHVPRPPPGGPVPPPPPPPPRSSHFGKILVALGTGGAAYYGYQNYDMIKEKMEESLPAPVLETLGMTHKRQVAAVEPPKIKPLPSPIVVPREEPVPVTKVQPTPAKKPEAPIVIVEPVDVKASHVGPILSPSNTSEAIELNKQLESRLLAAISSAEKKVKAANDAKVHTIQAIQGHAQRLKKAVDDGANANWDVVSESLINSERLSKSDMSEEAYSRNYIDSLRKIINDGKSNQSTANNPLLLNAIETANKLSYQLDELNSLVQKARNESRVLNQYKDLIDKSRQQFSTELKAILPDVDLNAKGKKLSEDEMNALIAHAHLRVDHLRRQLTEQQIREEQNIAKAIEEQRLADTALAHNQLQLEVQRVKEDQSLEVERGLQTERKNWETELEERLRRAAQAHSEHLEQVVRTQKQLYDIENAQAVEEAVSKERRLHSKQVDLALSKLSGIESALQSRVAADAENRRAKQYWLACQNLVQSIIHGQKAGMDMDARRKPLDKELEVIQQACEKDEFVQDLMTFFSPDTLSKGVYSEQDLRNRFADVYSLSKRTAKVDENGGGVMAYVSSYIQSLFMLELPRRFSPDDKVDLNHTDNYEIIARAKYFVEQNDFDNAVRVMQLLHGEPARISRDWIRDTKEHLASRFLAELLVAHAAVTSIRSTY